MKAKKLGIGVSCLALVGGLLGSGSALASSAISGEAAPAQAKASGVCHGVASGVAGKWGPAYKDCAYTSPASDWKGYLTVKWSAQHGLTCVEARESKAKNPDKWQSLSCGKAGEGKVKWPKNTASKLEVRIKSEQAPVENVQYSI